MPDIAIIFLSILFLLQLFLPKTRFNRVGFLIFSASLILVFGFAGFQSWQQYSLWKADGMGKFFLPPYQNWDYFIFYVSARFFGSYLLSLLIGLLFFFSARKLNGKYGERFFEPVEPYLLLISLFLSGTPGWLFYLIALLTLFLIINFSLTAFYYVIPDLIRNPDSSCHSELREESDSEILHSVQDDNWNLDSRLRGNDSVNTPIIQGKKEMPRIPLFYLWLPSAIFTILISRWLSTLSWWGLLKF